MGQACLDGLLSADAAAAATSAGLSKCNLEHAKAAFLASDLGSSYGYQGWLDRHWWQEVGVRFGPGQHYLDYTGAGQFTTSQLTAAFKELSTTGLGNPHSNNPSSARATQEVAAARALVRAHFNASPEEYHVIFTKGATEGLKMVGEYFPWSSTPAAAAAAAGFCGYNTTLTQLSPAAHTSSVNRSHFIYTQANHKSVLGIGAYAKQAGAQLHCITAEQMDAWLADPSCLVPQNSSSCGSEVPNASAAVLPAPPNSSVSVASEFGLARLNDSNSAVLPRPAQAGCSAVRTNKRQQSFAGTASMEEPQQPATPALGGSSSSSASADEAAGQQQELLAAACSKLGREATAPQQSLDTRSSSGSSSSSGGGGAACHLVAWPAKDNYEGRLYPQQWIKQVHDKSDAANEFFVLLDAAAFAATHALDMSAVQPDFLTVSFYKLFGYPTGLGALLVRKQAAKKLRKVYFGGGSVSYCTAEDAWHVLSPAPAGYEDGTLGFLSIACLKHGFAQLAALGGMQAISAHVESLRAWTYKQLLQLQHSNGQPLVRLFGRHGQGPQQQGGIFQFQVLTPEGDRVPGSLVEAAASAAGLHLRSGCNCNPGRCMANLDIRPEEERARAAESHKGPYLVVMRPQGHPSSSNITNSSSSNDNGNGRSGCANSSSGGTCCFQHRQLQPEAIMRLAEQQQQQLGNDSNAGHAPLVSVPLPLGSVRVSLGAYSTFEDCAALIRLLSGTFTDFEVYQRELVAGQKIISVVDDAEHVVKLKARVALAQ